MVKKHLGRGLSALLGDDIAEIDGKPVGYQENMRIEHLHPGRYQPRKSFPIEKLEQLAQSIAEQGVLQPILVRPHERKKGEYEILAGERRWRAAQLARLHEVPVIVREMDNLRALEIALIENVQRDDLNPLEEAEGYKKLIDEFAYSHDDLARRLGKSRPYVTQALRLIYLPQEVKEMLIEGKLSMSHARSVATAKDPLAMAHEIVNRNLSVREAEEWARTLRPPSNGRTGGRPSKKPVLEKDADTRALEKRLRQSLGLAIDIDFNGEGGKVTIHYKNLEQLDEITKRLG